MPTDPSLIADFVGTYSFEANSSGGADGSTVSTLGPYTVPGSYSGLLLKHNAVNGLKSFVASPGRALLATPPAVVPAPNLSGGAYPIGFSVMVVAKPTDLTNMSIPGHSGTRRTVLGFKSGWNAQAGSGGLEVYSTGKLVPSLPTSPTGGGYWGWNGPNGLGTVGLNSWTVIGLTSNGQSVKTFRGMSLDRTATNNDYGSGYTQFIGGLCIGADAQFPGLQDWTGEIAYVAIFSRALSDAEYRSGAEWLLTRYGLPIREVAVEADVGTSGTLIFFNMKSSSTGEKAYIPAGTTIAPGSVTYKVDGGSAITPAQILYQPVVDAVPSCAMIGFRAASAIAPGATVTLSIAEASILTNEGYVDALSDGPVTNNSGASAILPQAMPASVTMGIGFNLSGSGQYWTPEASLRNLLKCGGDNYGTLAVDAKGYRTSPSVGLRYLMRTGSNDATNGSRQVQYDFLGAEFGRYVVTWEGADGSDLAIEVSASDAGQTTVTPELVNDVMTGATKKRYFNVTEAAGSIRRRPAFDLVYKASVYVTNVKVMLARYEGETELYADQVVDRTVGCEGWRFMDFIPTNFSNIAHPSEFAVNDSLGYGSTTRRTIPIARIESYEGPHYSTDSVVTHYLVTTTVPHGIANGQAALIESTNGQPINVTHATRGVVDLTYKGWSGHALSPTTFYFGDYTPGNPHEPTTVPFTGSNAILSVTVQHGAPPEAAAALVNETGSRICHITFPHAVTDDSIRAVADRLHAVLSAGKKVDLELSNEVWNFAFSQFTFFRDESVRLGYVAQGGNDPYPSYTYHSARLWDVFKARWVANGRGAADLSLVLNFQQGNVDSATTSASWLQANRPDITKVKVAVAPYHYWNGLYNVSGFDYSTLTVEECLDFQECWAKAEKPLKYDGQVAAFTSRGIAADLIAYEYQWAYMGLGPEGTGSTRDERWDLHNRISAACRNHPRALGIATKFHKELQARGLKIAHAYGYNGGPVYEHGVVGQGTYGVYPTGLLQDAKKGDGTDGGENTRDLYKDGQGKPKWPPHLPFAGPMGRGIIDWNAVKVSGGSITVTWGVVGSPRTTPVDSVSLTFSDQVTGVGVSDFTLTRNGSPVSLSGVTLSGTGDFYTLSGLSAATSEAGDYVLTLVALNSGITTPTLIELSENSSKSWTTTAPAQAPVNDRAVLASIFNWAM